SAGELGVGDTVQRGNSGGPQSPQMGDNLPRAKLGGTVRSLASGAFHTCAILDTGNVKCWGNNSWGQLGQGDTTNRGDTSTDTPDLLPDVPLGTLRTARAIAGGFFRSCAWLDNGTVKCWGLNNIGQSGIGNTVAHGTTPNTMGDNLPAVYLRDAISIGVDSNH